jgi:hypothetical protein
VAGNAVCLSLSARLESGPAFGRDLDTFRLETMASTNKGRGGFRSTTFIPAPGTATLLLVRRLKLDPFRKATPISREGQAQLSMSVKPR